jgi:[acyl-carrier-protein] S-malonyltransferase
MTTTAATAADLAWFFPGQGSQAVGMIKDVLDASAAARAIFARADEALGEKLSSLILEGPAETLTLTANAQPAIVTASIAVLEAIRERVPELPTPAFAAGHSLGEYSALVAAGAMRFEDALRIVRARGKAMQEAVPAGHGAMSAIIGLDEATIERLCAEASEHTGEPVSPANYNAPGQIVIAGTTRAVARAGELAGEAKGKAIPLPVSAPFHCALMKNAAPAVERELSASKLSALAFPVVANVDAQPNRDPSRIQDLLIRQVDGAVRWEAGVRAMHEAGVRRALEIGPGKVLAGLAKKIAKDVAVLSVNDVASLDKVAAFLSPQTAGAS